MLLDRWSDATLSSSARAQCHKAIRQLATVAVTVEKTNYLAPALKGVYLVFAKRATKITENNRSALQQMLEEAADLYSIDPKLSAQHANAYIRQLTQHQKQAEKKIAAEGFKTLYTWQYVSCLDFWIQAISATCDPGAGETSPMQAVVQPTVGLALQTLKWVIIFFLWKGRCWNVIWYCLDFILRLSFFLYASTSSVHSLA